MNELQPADPIRPKQQPEIQPQNPSFTQLKKKQTNKTLFIGLGILMLVLFGITGVFAWQNYLLKQQIAQKQLPSIPLTETIKQSETPTSSPTTDSTTNWETYTNSYYGYALQHPNSWEVKEETGSINSQILQNHKNQKVTLSDKNNIISIFYEGDWDHGFEPWTLIKNETSQISGFNAQKSTLGLEGNDSYWIIYTIEDLHNFRIEVNVNKDNLELINQILSTFRFLPQDKI